MKQIPVKLLGLVLLGLGAGVIFVTLWHSYNIFTGEVPIPELFTAQEFTFSSESEKQTEEQGMEQKAEKMIAEQVQKQIRSLIPPEIIAKFLNLISWSIFTGIATFSGGKLGGLGISLLKRK